MTVLVTGGGGFLGLYIVERLVERGDRVRVFCRGNYPRLEELGVQVHRGDIRDAHAVKSACQDVETIFHTAAIPGIWGPWKLYYETNTVGTKNVIAAAHTCGVTKLIYTSSPSVVYDGREHLGADESLPYLHKYRCHYPHTKALAEQAVLAADGSELSTCALRPHLIWGPRDNHLIPRLIQRAKAGRLIRVGTGENLVSMSYVENVAGAHLQAADTLVAGSPLSGRPYFINEPEPVNLWNWIDQLLERAGLPPLKRSISSNTAYVIGAAMEAVYALLRLHAEPPMTRFLASQLSGSHYYSIAAAKRDFHYDPRITGEEAMRRLEPELKTLAARS